MATSSFYTIVAGGATVETATNGALSGDGSSGNKLAVAVDGLTLGVNGSDQIAISVLPLLTADPASPTNDTCWGVRTGTSPTQTVAVRARIAGATVTIAAITQ